MTVPLLKRRRLEGDASGTEVTKDGQDLFAKHKYGTRTGYQGAPASQIIQRPVTQNSSLYKLKLDALIAQSKLKHDRMLELESALQTLKRSIQEVPERPPIAVSEANDARHALHRICLSYFNNRNIDQLMYKLAYKSPARIEIVGSYARRTAVEFQNPLTVDLAVEMPSNLFHPKDFRKYRYFHKRAYYLACIATALRNSLAGHFTLEYCYQDDNRLQPILLVTSNAEHTKEIPKRAPFRVRIILAANDALFPVKKLLPGRKSDAKMLGDTPYQEIAPLYNETIRAECLTLPFARFLHSISAHSDSFRDACMLGGIWLRQQGFDASISGSGFGSFEWSCTMALLLSKTEGNGASYLPNGLTAYQMFKAVLRFFATTDLVQAPLTMPSNELSTRFDVSSDYGPILFDSVRSINVLYKMTSWSYEALRQSALGFLRLQSDPLSDHFQSCFITKMNKQACKYDIVACIPLQYALKRANDDLSATSEFYKLSNHLYIILKKGLGDRVRLIHIRMPGVKAWDVDDPALPSVELGPVFVGLVLNAINADRAIEKGPPAEDEKLAADFRHLWGEKAELRRFKDGSILEAVLWTHSEGSIVSQIIRHLLRTHFHGRIASNFEILGDHIAHVPSFGQTRDIGRAQPNSQTLYSSFESFEKNLRALKGLPLHIRQISAADPQLCNMSDCVPAAGELSDIQSFANVYLQFEASGRWPDQFEGIQRSKIAFLLKIGELLKGAHPHIATRLGLEHDGKPLCNLSFLDVLYPNEAAFRLRIHLSREEVLIGEELQRTTKPTIEREAAAAALTAYKRTFIQLPLHTQAMRMMSTRFPIFPQSVRLMKKWRDTHLLADHLCDELIELITLRTFLHPGSYEVPGTATVGLFRTLCFVARWDWRSQPFIIDMNGELSISDLEVITTTFEAWRRLDPAMNKVVMFAASNIDRGGTTWTESTPSTVAAARFTSLAKAATSLISEEGHRLQMVSLFHRSLDDYDFVIYMDVHAPQGEMSTGLFKNLQMQRQAGIDITRPNAARSLLRELRTLYNDAVVFFHSNDECCVIGGLWHPNTTSRSWKVHLRFSSVPTEQTSQERNMVGLNRIAILNDIARLGQNLVRTIKVKG